MEIDTIGPALLALGGLGVLVLIVLPPGWHTVKGWLLVSYVALPGVVLFAASLANMPALMIGLAILIGMGITTRHR